MHKMLPPALLDALARASAPSVDQTGLITTLAVIGGAQWSDAHDDLLGSKLSSFVPRFLALLDVATDHPTSSLAPPSTLLALQDAAQAWRRSLLKGAALMSARDSLLSVGILAAFAIAQMPPSALPAVRLSVWELALAMQGWFHPTDRFPLHGLTPDTGLALMRRWCNAEVRS